MVGDDDIAIEIDDDGPELVVADEVKDDIVVEEPPRKAKERPRDDKSAIDGRKAQDTIELLRKRTEEKYRREREQLETQLRVSQRGEMDARRDSIAVAEDATKAQITQLNAQRREAYAVGDLDKLTELDDALMEAKLNLRQIQAGRVEIESRIKSTPEPQDPEEAALSRYTRRTQQWLKAHPAFFQELRTSPRVQALATAYHHEAAENGIQPDTDEYEEFMETKLGLREAAEVEEDEQEDVVLRTPQKQQERRVAVSAPVSQRASAKPSRNDKTVRLTPEEVRFCENSGIDKVQYARQKRELELSGGYENIRN